MRATKFECEQRFVIFAAIVFFGFMIYQFDTLNASIWLLNTIAPWANPRLGRGENRLRIIFAAGAVLVLLASALRTWATAYASSEPMQARNRHEASQAADGPYRYTRNPRYLGNLLFMAGLGFMASRSGWIIMVATTWIFCYRLMLREEEDGQRGVRSEEYEQYLRKVPRFWPALSPRVPAAGRRVQWGRAMADESVVWLTGLAIFSFAINLEVRKATIGMAISFAVYFTIVYLTRKRQWS